MPSQIHIDLTKLYQFNKLTYIHSLNVAKMALLIGTRLNLDSASLKLLNQGALLHDIGKIFIPKHIISKATSLTPEEYDIIKTHTTLGADYLQEKDYNQRIVNIVKQHHENFNGTGYPCNLSECDIDILARIIRVADTFDAMRSFRLYQPAQSIQKIKATLLHESGTCYDPYIIKQYLLL